ncbi:MAG: hypothetical protein RIC55_23495 [Pirellulaceae bacterium]
MKLTCKSDPDALLVIANHHGAPSPGIKRRRGDYLAYHETSDGEQLVLLVNAAHTKGDLFMGDLEWQTITICNDRVESGVILGDGEWTWLALSWRVATGREFKPLPMQVFQAAMKDPHFGSEVVNLEAWRKAQSESE